MKKDLDSMTEQELRDELVRIRAERSGKGRERKKVARTKRMDGVAKDKRRKNFPQRDGNKHQKSSNQKTNKGKENYGIC